MNTYLVAASHPVDIAELGRLAAPGEAVRLQLADPHDQALAAEGALVQITPPRTRPAGRRPRKESSK